MQVTFDTNSASDVAFVKTLLGIPATPAAAPFPPIAQPAGSTQALPVGAPDGSYWVKSVGAPSLHDKDGNVLIVDWSATPPKVVGPAPVYVPTQAEQDMHKLMSGQ